jgi:hypothetical protein
MKLLHCLACDDVVALRSSSRRSCVCGASRGSLAQGTAQIIGPCRVIQLFDGAGDLPTGAAGGRRTS